MVKRHFPDDPVTVPADRARIARVLRNLTDNAARYTRPDGTLDICVVPGVGQVGVDFTNDGSGD